MHNPSQTPSHTADPGDAVVIIGHGAPASSAYEIVAADDPDGSRRRFAGFLDDAGSGARYPEQAPVGCIGPVRTLPTLDHHTRFVIATGSPASRRIVASWAASRGRTAVGVAHPSAVLDPAAAGPGYLVAAGARVAAGAVLGEHVQLGADVTVGAATLGAFVTIGADTEVGDGARIGDEVVLGRAVRIAPGVTVGPGAVVHDGVHVHEDVEPEARVLASELTPA